LLRLSCVERLSKLGAMDAVTSSRVLLLRLVRAEPALTPFARARADDISNIPAALTGVSETGIPLRRYEDFNEQRYWQKKAFPESAGHKTGVCRAVSCGGHMRDQNRRAGQIIFLYSLDEIASHGEASSDLNVSPS